MINFLYVLLPLFFVMLFMGIFFREREEGLSQALLYFSGIGIFLIGLYIIINGVPDVSHFLAESTGIIFWGIGGYAFYRASLAEMEEID